MSGVLPQTLNSVLTSPLTKLSLPSALRDSPIPPPNEPSNALKLSVLVNPQRALSAIYPITPMFNKTVLECKDLPSPLINASSINAPLFRFVVMSSRFPDPPLSTLPEEVADINMDPVLLRKVVPATKPVIEHTKTGLTLGVLGAATTIMTTVLRKQLLKKPVVDRTPFHPYAPSTATGQPAGGSRGVRRPVTDEFEWGLYDSSFMRDDDQSIGMLSWSSGRVRDPHVLTEDDVPVPKEVDARVLFFVFGAWYVLVALSFL